MLALGIGGLAACQPVGPVDQARLGGGVFDFKGRGAGVYGCGLSGQIETGRSDVTVAGGGSCSSCH